MTPAQQERHRAALDADLLARMVRAVASKSGLAAWRWVQ